MLQRAASNAYSWWWASHIRTKQSKWLEQNLQDMEEKVKNTLKLIEEDGDSFAKRAEMYYKKRPELIIFVEESYRAYRALAERYDHISGELQNANNTIATVFPEQLQFAMEGEDEDSSPKTSTHALNPSKLPKGLNIPKAPTNPMKDTKRSSSLITKKMQQKKVATDTNTTNTTSISSSGMSKSEALEEVDKLQKGILALQTEKEFVKSSYELGLAKYQEIEKRIKETQEKVFSLQDEFSVSVVIEDDEARTLMAATALKSCEESLHQLQEKQEKSAEEARVEYQRIKDVHEKLESLKNEFLCDKTDQQQLPNKDESVNAGPKLGNFDQEDVSMQRQKHELVSLREKIREHYKENSNTSFTVTELAERIDELVNKVITFENAISSQTALIERLRSETDDLQSHLRNMEEDKATLVEDSSILSNKVRELEEELLRIRDLNRSVEDQNNHLQTHFTEACCNLDHLSEKLQSVKPDEEVEIVDSFQEADVVLDIKPQKEFKAQDDVMSPDYDSMIPNDRETKVDEDKDEIKDQRKLDALLDIGPQKGFEEQEDVMSPDDDSMIPNDRETKVDENKDEVEDQKNVEDRKDVQDHSLSIKDQEEGHRQSEASNSLDDVSEQCQDLKKQDEFGKQNSSPTEQEEDQPNWQQLFLNGLEDREKILLTEYTSILRNYKELKKKLSEVEKKNRDSLFELTVQMRELRSANVLKDEEIRSLRQKLSFVQTSFDENPDTSLTESEETPQLLKIQSVNSEHQPLFKFLDDQPVEPTARTNELNATNTAEIPPTEEEEEEGIKVIFVDEPHTVSTVEEKFRMDIDALLEENLEFWLRFSTSFHQIQNFQTAIQDLQAELSKLKENKKQEGSTTGQSLKSDARPIYKHLREIQTEMTVWWEQNALLKDELKTRFSSLCNIQEEISKVSEAASRAEVVEFTSYQAAKFQGEVLNMQQENNKVADELQAGLDHVSGLQIELERTLSKLNEDFGLSGSKNHRSHPFHMKNSISRSRIPLRSFIFGNKSKKPKPSLFSCMNPALQKQYSDLRAGLPM